MCFFLETVRLALVPTTTSLHSLPVCIERFDPLICERVGGRVTSMGVYFQVVKNNTMAPKQDKNRTPFRSSTSIVAALLEPLNPSIIPQLPHFPFPARPHQLRRVFEDGRRALAVRTPRGVEVDQQHLMRPDHPLEGRAGDLVRDALVPVVVQVRGLAVLWSLLRLAAG